MLELEWDVCLMFSYLENKRVYTRLFLFHLILTSKFKTSLSFFSEKWSLQLKWGVCLMLDYLGNEKSVHSIIHFSTIFIYESWKCFKQSENRFKSEKKEIKNIFFVFFIFSGGSGQGDGRHPGDSLNRHEKVPVTVVSVLAVQTVTHASSGDDRHTCVDFRRRVHGAFFTQTTLSHILFIKTTSYNW